MFDDERPEGAPSTAVVAVEVCVTPASRPKRRRLPASMLMPKCWRLRESFVCFSSCRHCPLPCATPCLAVLGEEVQMRRAVPQEQLKASAKSPTNVTMRREAFKLLLAPSGVAAPSAEHAKLRHRSSSPIIERRVPSYRYTVSLPHYSTLCGMLAMLV